MTKYAKINENGNLDYAPRNVLGVSNWITDEAAVLAAGYLPVAEIETPEGKYIAGYQVEDGKIVPVFADIPEPDYAEQRRRAYPDIGEQLDMLYWDKVNGTNTWAETIAEIKAAYPKPEDENEAENA